MNRKKKIWIAVIATPVILLLIVILALKIYLTSDRLSALVIPQIEKAINRTVEVKDISLSVIPALAISIDGLKVSGPPDSSFKRNDFISVENIKLKINIFKLIQSKLDISDVIVTHPSVYLEVTPEGKANYMLDTEDAQAASGTPVTGVGAEQVGAFLLSNLEVKDCKIEYLDLEGGTRMMIDGFHSKVTAESKGGDGKITIIDSSDIGKFSYGSTLMWYLKDQPVTAGLEGFYEPTADMFTIQRMAGFLKEIPFTVTGSLGGLIAETMDINLNIGSARAEMAHLLSLVPPDFLQAAKGLQSTGNVSFSAVIQGKLNDTLLPGVKGSFAVAEGKIQYTSLPKAISGLNMDGSFEKPATGSPGKGLFDIRTFRASAGSANISGRLKASDFEDPDIFLSLSGNMNLAEVKDFYPLEEGTDLGGVVTCDFSCQGRVKTPQAIKAQGTAEFKNVFMKSKTNPKPLRDLTGTVQFDNARIESKGLVMKIGESDLHLTFALRNYPGFVLEEARKSGGVPSATVTLNSNKLRTEDLMGEESAEKAPSQVPAQAKAENGPAAASSVLPPMNVNGSVKVDSLITDKFIFTNAVGNIGIADGIVSLKNFSVNAFSGKISTDGTLDLSDPARKPFGFLLDINSVEANYLLSEFSSFGKNLFGRLTMKSELKGDLNDTLGIIAKTLAGSGSVLVSDGKLLGFPLTTRLADYTGIAELREIDFQKWTNAFSIADGKVELKDLTINAGTTDFVVKGFHGLDGVMDYRLTVKLPASVSDRLKLPGVGAELVKLLKDKDDRINLSFTVTGETTSPKLSLSTKAQEDAAKQALEDQKKKLMDEGKKKMEDELKKKTQDGLKKLFKKPG